MFTKIQHVGYQVRGLDAAVSWFAGSFGSRRVGVGPTASGGANAFLRFGQIEVELLQPPDSSSLAAGRLEMHHVGYVVSDIVSGIEECRVRGLTLGEAAPRMNTIGQQLCYFDTAGACGTQIHLTQLPE